MRRQEEGEIDSLIRIEIETGIEMRHRDRGRDRVILK